MEKSSPRIVILTVAGNCNLKCAYCYQSYKKASLMSFEIAKKICDNEIVTAEKADKLIEFVFLGGEPLLNFDLIKALSEWIWVTYHRKVPRLSLRTNGTLLNNISREWLLKNKFRIDVFLSLDGMPIMQVLNRGVDQSKIDIDFFVTNWPQNKVKCVLYRDTVEHLSESVRYFYENKINFEIVIGEGFYWDATSALILEKELAKVSEWAISISDFNEADVFKMRVENFYPQDEIKMTQTCRKSSDFVCYDTDGRSYFCQMFTPLSQGNDLSSGNDKEGVLPNEAPIDLRCIKCPIRFQCRNCIGINLKMQGSIDKWAAPNTTCLANISMARGCAGLYLLKIQNLTRPITEDEAINVVRCMKLLKELQI